MFELPYAGLTLVGVNLAADTANDVVGVFHKYVDGDAKMKGVNYQKHMLSNAMTQNYLGTTALVGLKKNSPLGVNANTKVTTEKLYWALVNAKQMK